MCSSPFLVLIFPPLHLIFAVVKESYERVPKSSFIISISFINIKNPIINVLYPNQITSKVDPHNLSYDSCFVSPTILHWKTILYEPYQKTKIAHNEAQLVITPNLVRQLTLVFFVFKPKFKKYNTKVLFNKEMYSMFPTPFLNNKTYHLPHN